MKTPMESATIEVRVLFFARTKELAGKEEAAMTLRGGATVADLLTALAGEKPGLAEHLEACRVAVDEEFAPVELELAHGATVAIIPPVSGG